MAYCSTACESRQRNCVQALCSKTNRTRKLAHEDGRSPRTRFCGPSTVAAGPRLLCGWIGDDGFMVDEVLRTTRQAVDN
eukprot:6103086-Pyramimonas_sp.AAC.1